MKITKRKKTVIYLGGFPPPYGGVTIKNSLLLKYLSQYMSISFCESKALLKRLAFFIKSILSKKKKIIGISSSRNRSLLVTKLLYFFNKKSMQKSIYFMMGGVEANRIVKSRKEIKMYSRYKKIFVELESMEMTLKKAGLKNVSIYPNCRENIDFVPLEHKGFRCVFFSLISILKGADLVIEVAKLAPDIEFDFYGHIDDSFNQYFLDCLTRVPNIHYLGVFDSTQKNVYQQLSGYDVLLFPTRYKTEGIPGIIVESKIAGIPSIVSNLSYNHYLVTNMYDGIVLDDLSKEKIYDSLILIKSKKILLNSLKRNAKNSSSYYFISTYIDEIVEILGE